MGGQYVGDTWEWDGMGWTKSTRSGPGARNSPATVYDEKRRRILLFGGEARPVGVLGDTWELAGDHWARFATDGPAPRGIYAMAYDVARGRTMLLGGTAAPRPEAPSFSDTWEWDGQRWSRIDAVGPSARDHTQMVYDPTRRVIALHGRGLDQQATETWTYDGRAWTRAGFKGPSRRYAKTVFDGRGRSVLLYGGFARQPSNERWRLGESGWELVAPQASRDRKSVV